jgi:hypothetical protein
VGVLWPKLAQGWTVRPPMPLYRPGGYLNGREECGHRRWSAPSLLWLLLGIGDNMLAINFGRGREMAG